MKQKVQQSIFWEGVIKYSDWATLKKVSECSWHLTWSDLKTFSILLRHPICFLLSLLRTYLSVKPNENIIRCFNPFLQPQTWTDGDFSFLITPKAKVATTGKWPLAKKGFGWTWRVTYRGVKKHFSCSRYPLRMLASLLRIISICRNKLEHHMMLQSDFTITNVSWWWFFSFDTPSFVSTQ